MTIFKLTAVNPQLRLSSEVSLIREGNKLTRKYLLPPFYSLVRLQLLQQLISNNLREEALWEKKNTYAAQRCCDIFRDRQNH